MINMPARLSNQRTRTQSA